MVQSKKKDFFHATIWVDPSSVTKRFNMTGKNVFMALVIFVIISCRNEHLPENKPYANLIIKTGTICGWCAQNDTLTITGNSVRYVNYAHCSNLPTVEKNGELLVSDLDALVSRLNFSELKKLDLNSCNLCIDGCDDWISYVNGSQSHYIRFSKDDPKLQAIQAFVDQLNVLKKQYSNGN